MELIKKYLIKAEQQPLEVKAADLMKKCLHDLNMNNAYVSYIQAYEILMKGVDKKYLVNLTYEAQFIDDFYEALSRLDLIDDSSTDDSGDESSDAE